MAIINTTVLDRIFSKLFQTEEEIINVAKTDFDETARKLLSEII